LCYHLTQKFLLMKNLFTIIIVALLSACSPKYVYQPIGNAEQQTLVYTHGIPTLQQNVGDLYFDMDLQKATTNTLKLRIFISNNAETDITFDPQKLSVFSQHENGQGRQLKTYTAEGYKRRVKNQRIAVAAVLIAATAASAYALKDNNDPNCNSNQDQIYVVPYQIDVNSNTPNASEVNLQRPADGLLRIHTLKPGEALEGNIMIALKEPYTPKIILQYPAQDSTYRFVFERK
jgi:hypothetical protein